MGDYSTTMQTLNVENNEVAVEGNFGSPPSLPSDAAEVHNPAVVDPTGSEVGEKRKRGRPRKHDVSPKSPPSKRPRGRPCGSGNLQQLASIGGSCFSSAVGSLVAHVVDVKIGEDLAEILKRFSSHRSLSIQSAIGTLSLVEIYKPFQDELLTLEGPFDIISLSGSYTNDIDGDGSKKSLQMRISLAQTDGHSFAGKVGGRMIAGGPIKVILSSFKEKLCTGSGKKRLSHGGSFDSPNAPGGSGMLEAAHGAPSETYEFEQVTSNGFADGLLFSNNNISPAVSNGDGISDLFPLSQGMHSTILNDTTFGRLDHPFLLEAFSDPMTFDLQMSSRTPRPPDFPVL